MDILNGKFKISRDLEAEWHVQTKPTQLNVTLLTEVCTGGRILRTERGGSINYVTEVGKSIEIGIMERKACQKQGHQ